MRCTMPVATAIAFLLGAIRLDAGQPAPPNFGVVVPAGIYRGGQPDEGDLKHLREMGVRTIVKLNHLDLEEERRQSERLGMKFVSLPLEPSSAGESGSCRNVAAAVAILSDRSTWPVYLHCTHGRDRTGLVVGAYREIVERKTWASVDEELERFGHDASMRRVYPQISRELRDGLPRCRDEIARALSARVPPAAE